MNKHRHHFVPRFYLRAFQCAPKRIHVYNLKSSRAIKSASLRDQCYKHRFYGPTEQIEDALSMLEGQAAPILRSIIESKVLPAVMTEDHFTLCAFVALQMQRTTVTANRLNSQMDKMVKQAYSRDPRLAGEDMESVNLGYEHPVLESLRNLPLAVEGIRDLKSHLIVSEKGMFLTSDNPAFKYNQYCEEIQYMGITGCCCTGLQIFLPLAPHVQLLLYDGTTYSVKYSDRRSRVSVAVPSDVDRMNAMQLISADENVYASDWRQVADIERLLPRIRVHRGTDPEEVHEYGQDDDPNRSLLVMFERTPCLKLKLSFLSLGREARKIPIPARGNRYRKDVPLPSLPEPPLPKRTVTFSRFIGKR